MFGLTDHGTSGIMLFMKSHICNPLCRQLGLLNNSLFEEEKTAALFRSSRKTSDLTVQKVAPAPRADSPPASEPPRSRLGAARR